MQKKLGKIARGESIIANKVIAAMLVITLTFANFILLGVVVGKGAISYAAQNLEGQNSNTQHDNVKFDAYFMKEQAKTHSLTLDATENTKLYFALNIKEKGYFKNGSIELKSPNYKIVGELEASEIMQKIEGNRIQLKQISYGTEAIVDLPIGLEIENEFALEKINQESSLILRGTYVTENGQEVAIQKEIKLNINWTSQNKFNLTSQISKYKLYEETEKVLIQEKIKINKETKTLPIAKTKVEIEVPEYHGKLPEKIMVQANNLSLTTGKQYETIEFGSQNWSYNQNTKKVTIEVENKAVNGNAWAGLGEDEYTITYIYGKEAYENKQETNTITRKITTTVYTYSGNEIKENVLTNEETKTLTDAIGEIVTGKIQMQENISKGNLYANTNSNNRNYTTSYAVKQIVEIPYREEMQSIKIEGIAEQFIDEKGNKNSTKIGGVNYTAYTKTSINKEIFEKILGAEGYIIIKNSAGTEIGRIDKNTNKENEKYVLNYAEKQDNIVLETSKPVEEGNLIINHEKEIKADLPYLKNQLISFKQLETGMIIGNAEALATTTLEETQTKVDMTINKQIINKEENVEIKLELNNNINTSDLYVNPKFTVELPEYMSGAEIQKAEVLFDEELSVKKAEVLTNKEGRKELQIELTGTQTKFNTVPNTKGTTIIVQAKLTASKTGEGKAVLKVENKNAISYATDGVLEAVLNAYVATFLDITLASEQEAQPVVGEETNNPTESTNNENNQEEQENKQYLEIDEENETEEVYQQGENYIYSIALKDTTPEDIGKAPEMTEEDISKAEEISKRIDELMEKNELTAEEQEELDKANLEVLKLMQEFSRGEQREYYELLELKQKKENEINKKVQEYQTLKEMASLTEEQSKKLAELEKTIGEYVAVSKELEEYINKLPEKLTQEQEKKLEELENKAIEELEKLNALSQEQETRLAELAEKMDNETIKNEDDITIKNVELKLNLPKDVIYKSAQLIDSLGETVKAKQIEYDETNRVVILKLEKYPEASSPIYFNVETTIGDIGEEYKKNLESVINLQYEQFNKKETARNITQLTVGKVGIEIIKTTEGLKEQNKVADEITFQLQVKNIGGADCNSMEVTFQLPEGFDFQKIRYGNSKNNKELIEEKNPTITEKGVEIPVFSLHTGETITAYVTALVEKTTEDKNLTVEAIVKYKQGIEDTFQEEKVNWNVAVEKTVEEGNSDNPNNPNNPNNPDNPDNPNQPVTYSTSGYAWEDKNADGIKAQRDNGVAGVKARLVNINTKETIATTTTDENGKYLFNNVKPGEYQIIFEYNNKEYSLTEYKKTESEEVNSNAIKVEDGVAITDIIKVEDKNISYINIGLVNIPKFDMSLTKRVSKITVQNAEGTKTYSYNDVDLAKVEINGKYINGTTVLVEYKLKITNEGEIAGTVEKIVDYMPKEMAFSSDLNTNWVQDSDGNLYNTELSKITIEPGETKEITLVLRKKMTEENTGTINNRAEIVETSNQMNVQDFDSIPKNQVQGEDDISTANVIIGIKTGAITWYIILTIISLAILGSGVYVINRKVIRKR